MTAPKKPRRRRVKLRAIAAAPRRQCWFHRWFKDGPYRFCHKCGLGLKIWGTTEGHNRSERVRWSQYLKWRRQEAKDQDTERFERSLNLDDLKYRGIL